MAEEEKEVTTKLTADDRYGQIPSDIVEILKNYEYSYFREDTPIPFCGLLIYPVTVRNYEEMASCCSCFTLNKNEDPKGISMTHLDYLISKTQSEENNEGRMWSYKLQRLFELIFRITNGIKCDECGYVTKYTDKEYTDFTKKIADLVNQLRTNPESFKDTEIKADDTTFHCPKCGCSKTHSMISVVKDTKGKNALSVDGHIITKNDFNKLRQIVLFQNYSDYADESGVDPEIKRDHDERIRIQQAQNDVHATIEKKVVCLSITTNYKFEEIYNMSIRRFTMALSTVDDLINYKIMRQAVSSGFVSLPKGKNIEHWIYKPIKDIYGDSYQSTEQVKQSVNNVNG